MYRPLAALHPRHSSNLVIVVDTVSIHDLSIHSYLECMNIFLIEVYETL